jgi:hypothetical protein
MNLRHALYGQEDQAFGIHVDSFVAEEGRESTSLL